MRLEKSFGIYDVSNRSSGRDPTSNPSSNHASPSAVIAKHMRLGRQEDSHEFLRFCIDNMQLSEMFGKDP